MSSAQRFTRRVFAAAGVYGLLMLTPLYGMERIIAREAPVTHPEYFYGFIGVAVAWQLVFLAIARDPARLRAIVPLAIVEKLAFGIPAIALYAQHRIAPMTLGFGVIDLVLGALFAASYVRMRNESSAEIAPVARAA